MFVLDCSMTMAWLFEDEQTEYSEKVLDSLNTNKAIVPTLWIYEVLNVLLVAERKKRITHTQSILFLETLKHLPIEIEDQLLLPKCESLLSSARDYHLSAYDAAYLDLAMHKGYPLASLDKQLLNAASEAGVKLM